MESVDQFYQDDTHILGHGDQDLAVIGSLIFFFIREFKIGDLGHRFNDLIDLFTEFLDEFFLGDITILHDVM